MFEAHLWGFVKMSGRAGDTTGIMIAGAGNVCGWIVPAAPSEGKGEEAEESEVVHNWEIDVYVMCVESSKSVFVSLTRCLLLMMSFKMRFELKEAAPL